MQYQDTASRERGSRRRRLAAMAGTLYRAGAAAASEIREQYSNARSVQDGDSAGGSGDDDRPPSIPAAFPDVAIATGGDAQMVLFPMYAKRHVRKYKAAAPTDRPPSSADGASATEGYWQREFARMEDEKAVVDVNVHGWLYLAPQNAPLTRRNRLLIGLARRLSGIPAPEQWVAATPAAAAPSADASNDNDEDTQEAHKIARAAAAIERRGQDEKEVANRGGYSETPHTAASYDDNSSDEGRGSSGGAQNTAKTKTTTTTTSGYNTPASRDSSPGQSTPGAKPKAPAPPPPGPGKLTPRSSWASSITGGSSGNGGSGALEMTEAELLAANANLLARLGPFLTAPVVQQPVTLFFYNEHQSQSRTVETSDAGHFSICALLDFVPTHVRVLVASSAPGYGYGGGAGGNSDPASAGQVGAVLTEPLSAVAPIHLVEDRGVSVISDIDDTVKTSNIALGTREIFRNTFVRDLGGLAVDGIRAWYTALHDLGVQFHYCSNSPWQLFPMLATFLRQVGLPQGPLHLKQYRGMLQGIFEPVAERKRGTLEKILRDFPDRRFLLVGDSGEADLEVYTDLVLAHPGRILAIFIRDVTTPEQPGYFDAASTTRPPRPQLPSSLSAVGVDVDNDHNNNNNSSNGNHVADAHQRRPALPPRTASAPAQPRDDAGPVMGTLIDLADDGPDCASDSVVSSVTPTNSTATRDASSGRSNGPSSRRPLPPPRPSKPLALRGSIATQPSSSSLSLSSSPSTSSSSSNPPPPPPAPRRKPVGSNAMTALTSIHPLAQVVNNSSNNSSGLSTSSTGTQDDDPPPPPLPRRARTIDLDESGPATPVQRQRLQQQQQQLLLQDQPQPQPQPPNKKVDMWRRRLAHAQAVLGPQGVRLYTWRRGQDVAVEAVGIVKAALGQDDRQGRPDRQNVDSKNNA